MMEIKVNKEKCLICGMCASMNPNVFKFNDEGLVEADNSEITEENKEEVKEAMENCPVGAIEEETKETEETK